MLAEVQRTVRPNRNGAKPKGEIKKDPKTHFGRNATNRVFTEDELDLPDSMLLTTPEKEMIAADGLTKSTHRSPSQMRIDPPILGQQGALHHA